MKTKLTFAFLAFASQLSIAQLTSAGVLSVQSNKIIYDKVTDKIYASIPSSNGSNGNSIGIINPTTMQLEQTVYVGSEPTVLAISDDSQYIYVGFRGSNTIRKYNVATKTADAPFSVGTTSNYGPLYAGDIKVMPGNPNTIAVSKKQFNTSATYKGVAIYDNGVMRPTTSFNPESFTYDSADIINFETPELIIGLTTGSSDAKLRRIKVTSAGATDLNQNTSVAYSYATDFKLFEGYAFFDNGQVFDYKNGFLLGSFNTFRGQFSIDSANRLITFATGDNYNYNTTAIKRFNIDTFLPVDNTSLNSTEAALSLVNCGSGCIAYNTATKIYFMKDKTLSVTDLSKSNKFSISPNPVEDKTKIFTDKNIIIKSVKVMDASGKIVSEVEITDNNLSLEGLRTGVYYIQAVDNYGRIHDSKIIKK